MVEKRVLHLLKDRNELRSKAKRLYTQNQISEARELSEKARLKDEEALRLLSESKYIGDDLEIDYLLNI